MRRLLFTALGAALLGCGATDSADYAPGERNGAAVKTGVTACPNFVFYMVLPKQIRSDELATAIAVATDSESSTEVMHYSWATTDGSFSRTETSMTEYTCSSVGPHVLRVTAQGRNGCDSTLDLDVECVGP